MVSTYCHSLDFKCPPPTLETQMLKAWLSAMVLLGGGSDLGGRSFPCWRKLEHWRVSSWGDTGTQHFSASLFASWLLWAEQLCSNIHFYSWCSVLPHARNDRGKRPCADLNPWAKKKREKKRKRKRKKESFLFKWVYLRHFVIAMKGLPTQVLTVEH